MNICHSIVIPKLTQLLNIRVEEVTLECFQSHRGRMRHTSASASCSEESDNEPSPPLSRRGRRAAIVDTKVLDIMTAPCEKWIAG